MDVEKYIKEAKRQLSDKRNYKTRQEDQTLQHSNLVNNTIERFKNEDLLSTKLAEGLTSVNRKPSKFYISPKVHKESNPGRPVINSVNCHISEISRFVDHHLQPLVREDIKDTNDFTNKINNFPVPPNSLLVTMNVKSLYTSAPNDEGIASVKNKHDRYLKRTIPTKIIATFLALILTLNNFIFNLKFYLQTKGCAMGTICAPSYANIFMSEFLKKCIYPLI